MWQSSELAARDPGGRGPSHGSAVWRGQAQYVTVPAELLMPIPAGLTMCQAAAIPEAWLTAFQLLHLVGKDQCTPCSLHTA